MYSKKRFYFKRSGEIQDPNECTLAFSDVLNFPRSIAGGHQHIRIWLRMR